MQATLPKAYLQENRPISLPQKGLALRFKKLNSKLVRLPLMVCLFAFTFFCTQNVQAQVFAGSFSFTDANDASNLVTFEYEIVCSADGTSADLTVTFTGGTQPPGFVAAIQIQTSMGPIFPNLNGSFPDYTFTITDLTDCDFNFRFRFPYAGALYESPFLTPDNAPLPITLSNFLVTKEDNRSAKLAWKTSAEINSDYFGIERSTDGRNWETINQVNAAGFSNNDLLYSFIDANLRINSISETTFYYRLRMTDLDETYEYSDIRGVQFGKNNIGVISVYPNPTVDHLNIDLRDLDLNTGNVQLNIYNDSGSQVLSRQVDGNDVELVDMTNLPAASYHIILKQGTELIYQSSLLKLD